MSIWLIRAGLYGQYEQKFIQEPNFLYNRLRPDHELRMNEKANEIADAALAKQEQ
jgi:hypothetical protein